MKNKQTTATFENVEDRILYSADSVAAMEPAVAENNNEATAIEAQLEPEAGASDDKTNSANDDTFLEQQRQELVFIDADVEGHEALLDDLLSNGDDREFQIHYLQGDGIDQISAILDDSDEISAIHIISHGSDAQIDLGETRLTTETIAQYSDTFNSWQSSLTEDADILIYGCNVAATEEGQTLLHTIANSTGADVSASEDLTGHVDQNGDWELEYSTGAIETEVAVSEEAQQNWQGLLAETVYTSYETSTNTIEVKSDTNYGQTFTHTSGNGTYDVNQISLLLSKDAGAVSQNLTVSLRTSWNGADLASSTISSDTLSTTQSWVDFDFSDVTLNDAATYFIRITSDSGDGKIWLGDDPSGSYANGNKLDVDGSALSGEDLPFRIVRTSVSYPASYGDDNTSEWITNVTFGDINNSSGADAGGYGDYTSESTILTQGSLTDLSVTINPATENYISAWIDWNQDGDFEDAGEEYIVATNTSAAGPHTVSITTPNDAALGSTQMRVSLKYFTAPPSSGMFNWGEVEDYTINVVSATNASPVLSGANNLTAINEDDVSNVGTLVSALISGQVSDVDAGASEGIAVVGVDNTNGTWEYTTDGTNWNAFGAVNTSSARLLAADANTSVRFIPNANYNGTVTNGITFHAWDQTSGTAGATVDLTSSTVRDEFTTASYTNNDGSANWTSFWQESGEVDGSGSGLLQITGGEMRIGGSQEDTGGGSLTREVDLSGAGSASLTYDYRVEDIDNSGPITVEIGYGGGNWRTLATYIPGNSTGSESFDITGEIAADTQVRFSYPDKIEMYLYVDNVQIEYTSAGGAVGGNTAFSAAAASSNITVNAVNDAPTAQDKTIITSEDTTYTFTLADFGYNDVDGDPIAHVRVLPIFANVVELDGVGLDTSPQVISITDINDGKLTFVPPANSSGTADFMYFDVNDGSAYSAIQTMTANITPVNDAPVATADPGNFNTALQNLNPISYWRLGDASGAAVDAGSSANNGSYNGATLSQAGGIYGDSDTAVRFDGNDYVEIAHSNDYLLDNGTIQVWFNPDTVSNGDLQHLFSKDATGFGTGGHVSLYLNASGQLEARLQSATTDYIVSSSSAVAANEWQHAALSFGTSGLELYLNGQLVDSDAYTGGLGTTSGGSGNANPITIGAGTQNSSNNTADIINQYFTGSIDEVAIMGSQLNSQTILNLYNAGANQLLVDANSTLSVNAASGVLANDSDVDGDSLSVSEVNGSAVNVGSQITLASGALVTVNADGSFDYDPNGQFDSLLVGSTATDTFTYTVSDGNSGTDTAVATITIAGTNVAPTFIGDSVGYWQFDEGSGDTTADSAYGTSTGTLGSTAGADANDPVWTTGRFGQALQFDGVNDYVEIADAPELDISGPEFSASLWMKPDSGPNNEDMLFMKGDRQGNVNYYLSWKNSNEMTWAFKDGAGWHYQDMAVTLPTTGQWNHVAITFDRPTVTIYVNGTKYVFDDVATGGSMDRDLTANNEVLWIGAGRSGGSLVGVNQNSGPFSGAIDDLAIFDRALTDAEVEAIRTSQTAAATATTFSVNENAANTTVVGTVTANDPDGDTLTYSITGGNTNGAFAIDNNGVITVANSTELDFETTPIFVLTIQADDGDGGTDTQAVTINLNNVNPVISATGAATVNEGELYTLNLSADESVTTWTINWGDGTIDTVAGGATTATHTFTNGGFTNNITVSATDATGTVFTNSLIVGNAASGTNGFALKFGFDPATGLADTGSVQTLDTPTPSDLDWAQDVVVGPDGNIYVSGYQSQNVIKFDGATGAYIEEFVSTPNGITTIAFGPDGNLYIASDAGWVKRYDGQTGAYVDDFLTGLTFTPEEIEFSPDGVLYIGDYEASSRIWRYDVVTGNNLDGGSPFIDPVNNSASDIKRTQQIAWGPDGNLYIASQMNGKIQRFDGTTGAFIDTFAEPGVEPSGWPRGPTGLAFGPDGNMYVAKVDTVIRYDGTTGAYIDDYVGTGSGLNNPWFITFTPNHQVKVNAIPEITSDGGGATANVNVAENTTAVTTVEAFNIDGDTISYSITAGVDASLFEIDNVSGALTLKNAPDFETPADSNSDNVYQVQVTADDGNGGTDVQTINVTITNVNPDAQADAYTVSENGSLNVDWWDTDWAYRQQLTFDNLAQSETLTDFPVLVLLNSSNIDYAKTNDDGSDLRFFAADGTALAYEIEQWNEGGDSSVWVRVPQITGNSNSDSITMYYGNASADYVASSADVWDSNFVGVWHLNEEQAGTDNSGLYADSTSNGNNGIDRVAATGQDGQVTDGQELGANDWIEIDHDASLDLKDSMTISFWIKPDTDSGTFNRVLEKGLWGYNTSYYFGGGNGTNDLTFYLNGQEVIDTADNVLTTGVWQHAAISYTSNGDGTGTARMYLNGTEIATGNYTNGVVAGNTGRLAIGHDDGSFDFDGSVDEVQISNTDRSADWIAAQYQATRNQFGNEFVQFGGEQSASANSGVLQNDTLDSDNSTASSLDTTGTLGLVTLNPDGTFTYDPNGQFESLAVGETADDTFSYTLTDPNGFTETVTVTITVQGENDTPTVSGESIQAFEGRPYEAQLGTDDLLMNDSDIDGDTLTVNTTPVSGPANGSLVLNADGTFTYTGNTDFNGMDSFVYEVSDGNGGTAQATVNIEVFPREVKILFTTAKDISSSKVSGIDSWESGEVLGIGDPNLSFEPVGSDGSILNFMNLETFAADTEMVINGIHYVNSASLTLGTTNTVTLQQGDILFVSDKDETMTSTNSLAIGKNDVIAFRPDVAGDYSSGTFFYVLDLGGSVEPTGITMIEQDITIGDVMLERGEFLITQSGKRGDAIYHYDVAEAGQGTTSGTESVIIDGADMGANNNKFDGVMVVSEDLYLEGTMVAKGSIITTLNKNDTVADNNLSVRSDEIIYLTVNTTTMGSGTTSADATLLFDGSEIGLNNKNKKIHAFAILENILPPNEDPAITLTSGSVNYTESDPATVIDGAAVVADPDSVDFNGGILRIDLDNTGTANDRLAINNEGTGAGQIGISGSDVTYAGVTIGSFNGGTDGTDPLLVTFNANADVAAVQALARNITFENVSDEPSTNQRSARFSLTDGDGGSSTIVSRTITVNGTNAAPTLNGANDLTAINEDEYNSSGTLVSALIAGQITDADAGALEGIAIIAVDNTNGSWQFTTDGGSNWTAFGSPSATAARLLAADADTSVRFVPNENWNGTVTNGITFHAWDQSLGMNGDAVNLSIGANVADDFSTTGYSDNDGTQNWDSDWSEVNDDGSAGSGNVRIESGKLRLDNQDGGSMEAIVRGFDLDDAATATLTFDYEGAGAGGLDSFAVEIYDEDTQAWTTVDTINVVGSVSESKSYLLEDYVPLTEDMQLRFRLLTGFDGAGQYISIDNVDIGYGGAGIGGNTSISTATASSSITVNSINDAPQMIEWFNADWSSRKALTIDSTLVQEDLTDFPLLVSLTVDAELAAQALANGDDIIFTAGDGATQLAHEIEFFDETTGELRAWVKTDLSADIDTDIFMYFGNATASNSEDAAGVWSSNYVGVYHLNESPDGSVGELIDASGNGNNATTEGGMNAADSVNTAIGSGLAFDGSNDKIRIPDSASLDGVNDAATFSLWVNFVDAADGDSQIIMTSENRFSDRDGYEWASQGDGDHFFYPDATPSDGNYNLGPNPFTNGQWHHLAATMDFATKEVNIYIDGNPMTFVYEGVTDNWTALSDSGDLLFGGNPDRASRFFQGMMDEIRIADTVRSQAWLQTEYNNQSAPATFFTVSTAESTTALHSLTDINEDTTDPAGDSVLTIINSVAGDRITDDDDGAVEGIAVVGVDDSNGQWQYDANADGTWVAFGSVSDNAAVLLDTNALVRFVPNADYEGNAGNLSFRAWDQSAGSNGDTGVDVTSNGDDSAFSSETVNATLNVNPVEDAAVVSGSFSDNVNEGDIGDTVQATGTLSISDVDADDNPSFADQGSTVGDNGYGSFVLSSGNWTYTVDQSTVQDLDAGDSVNDTITYTASDGTMQQITVTINGTDDAAVVSGTHTDTVVEGDIGDTVTASGTLGISDVDADDNPSFADQGSTIGDNGYGSFVLSSGTWTYTVDQSTVQNLDAGDSVNDTITYTATDGTTQQITVTINGSNDAPVAVTDTPSVNEDNPVVIDVLANDTDPENDTLTVLGFERVIAAYDAGDSGSAPDPTSVAGGSWVFSDTEDGDGATGNATVAGVSPDGATGQNGWNVTDNTETASQFVRYDGVLDAGDVALAASDGYSLSAELRMVDDFGDTRSTFIRYGDGTTRFVAWFDLDSNGDLVVELGDDLGAQFINVTNDGTGADAYHNFEIVYDAGTGTAAFLVNGERMDNGSWGGESSAFAGLRWGVGSGMGQGSANFHSVQMKVFDQSITTANGATVVNNGDGTVTYTPDTNYNGADTFTYTIKDTDGHIVNGTVNMTVNPEDDAPVVNGTFTGSVNEGNIGDTAQATGTLSISDVDDGDNPVFADQGATVGDNAYGSFVLNSGNWTYTLDQSAVQDLDAGDVVNDTITYTASDGTTQQITVTINGTDDAPVVSGTHSDTVNEGNIGDTVQATGTLGISDVDGDDNPSFADQGSTVGDNAYGSFVLSSGNWTYTVNQSAVQFLDVGESVNDTITYTATDGTTQTITVTINGTEDGPTVDNALPDQTATQDLAFNYTFAANSFGDLDASDTLTYTATLADDSALPAWLNFDAVSRTFSGTPADSDVGVISVKVTANDGSSTVSDTFTLTVNDVNDAPVLVNDTITATEGVPYIAQLGVDDLLLNDSDPDGDTLTVNSVPVSGPANGTLVLNTDGTFIYTPNTNFNGTDSFVYEVSDGNGNTSQATANITVQPREVKILFSTEKDIADSDAAGIDSWESGDVIGIGDPNLAFEPVASDGTVSKFMSLEDFAADSEMGINGLHFVSSATIVGNTNSVALQQGDLLFISDQAETMTSTNTLAINKHDVIGFRPDVAGDYSSGTFFLVLDLGGSTRPSGLTMIEQDITIGDVTLEQGDFIFTQKGKRGDAIYHYAVDEAGAGTTSGTESLLIDGADLGVDGNKFEGVMVVSEDLYLKGTTVAKGSIITTLNKNDTVGDNNLNVRKDDMIYLTVNTTTMGSGTTSADATLLFDGSDIGLGKKSEKIQAFAILENVLPSNEDPVINVSAGNITYNELDPAIIIDSAAAVSDTDSANFDRGIFRVDLDNTGSDDDRLAINNEGTGAGQIGISGNAVTYGGVTIGTFTGGVGIDPLVVNLNSNADATAVQALARNITFENVSSEPSTTDRLVRFMMTDGDGGASTIVSRTIEINSINSAPVLNGANDLTAINEDDVTNPGTLVSALVAGQITDVDPGALSGIAVVGVGNTNGSWEYTLDGGTNWIAFASPSDSAALLLAADADTSVRFVPDADWNGTVTNGITFRAWDQSTGTAGSTVDLTLTDSVRDEFNSVTYSANDGSGVWTSDWTEYDDDGNAATGNIRIEGNELHIDNQDGGELEYAYRTADLAGATNATLTFDFDAFGAGTTDAVFIDASNDGGATWTTLRSAIIPGSVVGTRSVDVNEFMSLTNDMVFRFGVLAGMDGPGEKISFDNIDLTYSGPGTGGTTSVSTATASSNITVNPVNDAASITGQDTGAVTEDVAVVANTISATGTLSVTDIDTGENSFTAETVAGTYGSVTIDAGGNWTYTADNTQTAIQELGAGDSLTDIITVRSADGTTQDVTITINGTEDSAVVTGTTSDTVNEGDVGDTVTASGTISISDVDADDSPSFADVGATNGDNGYGSFVLTSGTWTYTVDQNAVQYLDVGESVNDTITYTATDGTTQTITVTINGTEDGPTVDNTISNQTAVEDSAFNFTFAANTFGDLDASDSFTYTATLADDSALPAWLSFDGATRTFSGTPTNTDVGTISVKVTANDGSSSVFDIFNITVNNVSDPPVIGGVDTGSVTEDSGVVGGNISTTGSMTISDPDAGESSFNAGTYGGSYGSVTIDAAGNWTYTADNSQAAIQSLDAGESITDTVTVTTFDGTSHDVVITINGAEDASVIGGTATGSVSEDGTLTATDSLTITDVDTSDNPVSFNDVATTAGDNGYGTFEMTGNSWTYTLNNGNGAVQALGAGETLTDTYTFSATDGSTQTVTVTINGSDDAAVIGGTTSGNVTEGDIGDTVTASGTITISDTDSSDTPAFADQAATGGDNGYGSFVLSSGNWTYTLDQSTVQTLDSGDSVNDTITYTASDGTNAVVTVAIAGSNDGPGIINNELSYVRGESVVLNSSNISTADVDDTATEMNLTVSGVTGGQFERVSNPGVAITSFSQDEINNGDVRFVHDGVTTASYSLTVSDSDLSDGPLAATITELAPAPVEEDTELLVLTGVIDLNEITVTEVELTTSEGEGAPVKIEVESIEAIETLAPEVIEATAEAVSAPLPVNLQAASDEAAPQPGANPAPLPKANNVEVLYSYNLKTVKLADNIFMKLKSFDSKGIETIEADEDARRQLSERAFDTAIKELRKQLGEKADVDLSRSEQVVAAVKSVGLALSVGSVSWLLRVEWLFSFLVSSLPAWQRFDPLPVLNSQRPAAPPAPQKNAAQSDKDKQEQDLEEKAASILQK